MISTLRRRRLLSGQSASTQEGILIIQFYSRNVSDFPNIETVSDSEPHSTPWSSCSRNPLAAPVATRGEPPTSLKPYRTVITTEHTLGTLFGGH